MRYLLVVDAFNPDTWAAVIPLMKTMGAQQIQTGVWTIESEDSAEDLLRALVAKFVDPERDKAAVVRYQGRIVSHNRTGH